tara:strand:+ start:1002 stop:3239 length:2238 start_codon:yes stop_codon:yes gene_type:complete
MSDPIDTTENSGSSSDQAPIDGESTPGPMAGPNLVLRLMVGLLVLVIVSGTVWILSSPSADGDGQAAEDGANPADTASDTLAGRNPFLSTGPGRKTLEGNWVLIISQPDDVERRFDEICSGLFILAPRRGNLDDMTVRLSFRTPVFPEAKIVADATVVDRTRARIVFVDGTHRVDFDGTLGEDGIVYGNVVRGDVCQAARLMPTDEVQLDSQITVMSTLDRPKLDAVVNKAKTQKLTLYDTYRLFCSEHPGTSLALDISLKNLMGHADPQKMPLKDYLAAVDEHLELTRRWGPRMKLVNMLILSHVAFTRGYPPKAAIGISKGLSQALGEQSWAAPFQRRLAELIDQCDGTQARVDAEDALKQLASKSTTDREAPLAKLYDLRKKFPYSHFVTFGLAEEAEKAKKLDEAIALYGEIVALPLLERLLEFEWESAGVKAVRPGDTLARLWKQKHGDTKGLPAFLDTIYQGAIDGLAKSPGGPEVPESKSTGRSVLCELFTTVRADSAVAAELSTAALARRLGANRLIVVRYHPLDAARRNQGGGDPLSNDASLSRLSFYRGRSLPAVYLDGRRLPSTDGLLADTSRVHGLVFREIVKRLSVTSDWKMTLSAKRTPAGVQVKAGAESSGAADGEYRMRLLLVEEKVMMPAASNGVRVQEMVVRWQIDGGEGVAPKDGKFAVTESLLIDEVRKQLADDLSRFERLQGMNFPEKPLELKSLFVIGLVQDETTREVLQSIVVPVTGGPSSN